ncbi:MAG TPA: HDIG domain-containing protein [Kofleriaceae bacterium]|nr:HDIG domain-containing protein [Kofleriaceae bacterium]
MSSLSALSVLSVFAGAAVAAATSALVMVQRARRHGRAAQEVIEHARSQAAALVATATLETGAERVRLDTAHREEILAARTAALDALRAQEAALEERQAAVQRADAALEAEQETLEQRSATLEAEQREVQSRRDRASGLVRDTERRLGGVRGELERIAEIAGSELARSMKQSWLEEARAQASARLREVEAAAQDPAHDREAKRLMEIAASRYQIHFLTERNVSTLRLGPELVGVLLEQGGALHAALEKVSNVQLQVNDDRDAVRLEGQDSVGREIARRALGKLQKKPEFIDEARRGPEEYAARARQGLEQEIRALGKRAFQLLGIPRAHPEIVDLVGALNFRTSYTQNQWWHAVEASYLAGLIAAELGLDEKLARRATLMHDIGKALTHKIEGSHAVIGADIARRLGESELVANAIGAHHADEPCNSAYAYLVAACDAMSGARPGARRELAEGFTARVEDLERIGESRRGVVHAHAVHGGRELRVYVRERDVDDLAVVEMSSNIAAQISEEMTFPGQIKVTVIRSFEAVATAN